VSTIPPYMPPFIGPNGLTVASYQSILADNLQAFLNIYGQSMYIAPDSAIYQLLSVISLKQADANLGLQLAYNQSSPQTAVGAGLDRQVKMNGLAREPFTYSTAVLTLTGAPGLPLINAFVQDQNGNLWAIPSPTDIVGGSVNVTATCTTPGNVTAGPNTITILATPVLGWASATNAAAAVPGNPVETDSELRARQSISVALPALTTISATIAAVLAVSGVTRVSPGYPTPGGPGSSIENPTGATDSWGNPAHSITMVVEGGTNAAVAQAIYSKRGIGPFTNGTTSVPVVDPTSGVTMNIGFYRPTYIPVAVFITVVPLAGFSSSTALAIQAGLVNYLNSLSIGEQIVYSELYGAALTARPNPDQPLFSITALTCGQQNAQTQAALTATSSVITVVSAAGIAIGQYVVDNSNGSHIPANTIVTNVSGTSITLSNPAFTNASSDVVSFFTMGSSTISVLFYQATQGAASNVVVTS
jgi:uncharacterized phage protein gp47/JayE